MRKKSIKLSEKRGMEIVYIMRQRTSELVRLGGEDNKKRALTVQRWADDMQRQLGKL